MTDDHRDALGRRVREVWVLWAERQENPKPSWLVPYDELSEADKEADRCLGSALWGDGFNAGLDFFNTGLMMKSTLDLDGVEGLTPEERDRLVNHWWGEAVADGGRANVESEVEFSADGIDRLHAPLFGEVQSELLRSILARGREDLRDDDPDADWLNAEHEHSLVMPYVVTKSNGGPLDDHAFVCGARFGQIDQEAQTILPGRKKSWYVEPEMVPQYDLLAMHLGLTMTAEPWDEHPDEWVLIEMLAPDQAPDGSDVGGGDASTPQEPTTNRDVIEGGGKTPGDRPATPPVAQDHIPEPPSTSGRGRATTETESNDEHDS